MNTCKTCLHWVEPDDSENWNSYRIATPIDMDTYEPMTVSFEMRICKSPKICYFERPPEPDGVTLVDGSEYYARMLTGESFGCNNYVRR